MQICCLHTLEGCSSLPSSKYLPDICMGDTGQTRVQIRRRGNVGGCMSPPHRPCLASPLFRINAWDQFRFPSGISGHRDRRLGK